MKEVITSIVSLGIRVSGAAAQFVMSWIILQNYGVESVGVFFTGLMAATGIAVGAKKGIDVALVQYLPGRDFNEEKQKKLLSEIIKIIALNALLVSMVVIAFIWVVFPWAVLMKINFSAMALSSIGMSLNMAVAEYLKIKGKIYRSGITQFISVPLIMCLIMVGIDMMPEYANELSYSPEIYWCAIWMTVALVEFIFSLEDIKEEEKENYCEQINKIKKIGNGILGVNILGFIISWMDIIMANVMYGAAVVGAYGMLSKVAMAATFATVAVTSVYGRKISHAYNNQQTDEAKLIYRNARQTGWLMILPLVLAALIFHKEIVQMIGGGFQDSSPLIIIMMAAQAASLLFGPANYALIMIKRSAVLLRIYGVGIVAMVLASVIFSMVFGVYGVALGVLAGHILINGLSYACIKKWIF